MLLDRAHYHAWDGRLGSPWRAVGALVRVTLLQVIRRKAYWVLLALAVTNLLKAAFIVYLIAQLKLPTQFSEIIAERAGFSGEVRSGQETGYTRFMDQQSVVVMLLLAFSGSLLVGADFRQQVMPFYLSRKIERRHYIAGKLLAISALVALTTVVPTLFLFIEYGMLTSSFEYWQANWHVLGGILAYGLMLSAVLSTLLAAISAWLERAGPIVIAWCSMFLLLNQMATVLADKAGDEAWKLLDPWFDIHRVSSLFFGAHVDAEELTLVPQAAAVLFFIGTVALAALVYRVRAVDVVK
ncbi:MAG: hypothetical protein JSS27_20105 [Planctomycetes bacterium]|nr:hypothetical protein [Planctomycetota bacterium]